MAQRTAVLGMLLFTLLGGVLAGPVVVPVNDPRTFLPAGRVYRDVADPTPGVRTLLLWLL
jgi:hypothetical protein